MKAYLIAYNLASAGGWAYVLYLAVTSLLEGHTPTEAWARFGTSLMVVQSTMAFEILHALLGLVRSPVFVTALQVSSRLWVVWGATYYSTACQAHWSIYLMVISWCCAEVPRYLFYVGGLLGSIPFPLFFVRYSAFMVLYPTGITGEIFQILSSLEHWEAGVPVWFRTLKLILVLYAPGSPFMINNMFLNRKGAFKKRAALSAGAKPVSGLSWPVTDAKTGERGSTRTNKAIWVAAVKAVDERLASKAAKEKNWRYGYAQHIEANVRASLKSSSNALEVAKAGLHAAQSLFEFVRPGRPSMSLAKAMDTYTENVFETHSIKGSGPKPDTGGCDLSIPYAGQKGGAPYYLSKEDRHKEISGPNLVKQLDQWVAYGVMEEDCACALKLCVEHKEWLDLSNHYFVLLGAGSAMGPLPLLLSLGANVYAVDIDRPQVWAQLLAKARDGEYSGEFTFPIKASKLQGRDPKSMSDDELASVAGADLLNDTPEIATWLSAVCPQKRVTVGNYTYLDGALHVQLSLACDAIIAKLAAQRPDLALAFLCTPTDCHAVPRGASEAAFVNEKNAPLWQKCCKPLALQPNALKPVTMADSAGGPKECYLVDGTVSAQGPNYILAKRLQHWRAMVEWSRGHAVSSNVAPSTATASVVHNAQFAAAYGGMHLFAPMEVMYAETSNAVMGALLIHDVRNPQARTNPKGSAKLDNPLQIFANGSFHGGAWRCGFKMGSTGELSALCYYLATYGAYLGAGAAGLASLAAWVATGQVAGGLF